MVCKVNTVVYGQHYGVWIWKERERKSRRSVNRTVLVDYSGVIGEQCYTCIVHVG